MGVFLDKPKKEKESESGEGNGLRFAMCAMQGWRVEMEDAHAIRMELHPTLKNCSYFAVFDGHAGDFVSKYSSENLIETILELWTASGGGSNSSCEKTAENKDKNSDICNAHLTESVEVDKFRQNVIEGFLKIDSKMRELPKFLSGEERSGTTAVASFVTPNKIIFANCGDSRALLCSNKEVKFATYDHKPYNEEERKRIENAGGSVMIQRVNGSLAVSRALGDYDYKNVSGLSPTEQLVSAEPDLTVIERSEKDEFLILACDGVWDVMSNEEVVTYIHSRLVIHQDLQRVCEELLETCLAKGSRDNMSVILITFPSAPQVANDAVEKEAVLNGLIKENVKAIVESQGETTTLSRVIDELQSAELEGLPPGGGLYSKLCLIEATLDELMPNRSKEEGRGVLNSLPVPLSVLRQMGGEAAELQGQQGDMYFPEEGEGEI
ncbi:protein phosphatase 1A-like [Hydractinia symbiolongicarpus]|uniref:protein phosphatase 1A-like n=1 Tax=Hydractinia symbiolongicarpus TaxID=13093 RepID=UPI00254C3926|nr:protein phosphatase 1A-like [Hydractinia symbiolongicarpus]